MPRTPIANRLLTCVPFEDFPGPRFFGAGGDGSGVLDAKERPDRIHLAGLRYFCFACCLLEFLCTCSRSYRRPRERTWGPVLVVVNSISPLHERFFSPRHPRNCRIQSSRLSGPTVRDCPAGSSGCDRAGRSQPYPRRSRPGLNGTQTVRPPTVPPTDDGPGVQWCGTPDPAKSPLAHSASALRCFSTPKWTADTASCRTEL